MTKARTFLTALLRDTRANTMAMMAMALIPLAGMVGGGVDISRMYIVKTRLQHACDAGALAGRKAMGGGSWNQNNYLPRTQAERFFDANIQAAPYGATEMTRAFGENAGKVTGTASAVLPMTLMRIFGRTTETLTVTCDAEMRLPNTDVMFVLDTTGSMNEDAGGGQTRIQALRLAVKCFYEIVARLDTNANCTTGTPSGGTGNQVQIRFGFVPYSSNVNVGKLLPNSYFADNWTYQTRRANWNPPGTTVNGPFWEVYGGGAISQANCLKYMNNQAFYGYTVVDDNTGGPYPNPTVLTTFPDDGSATAGGSGEWGWYGASDTSGDNRSCRRLRTEATTTYLPQFRDWTYDELEVPVDGFKAGGSNWNNSVQMKLGTNGADKTITWDGCIEERHTVRTTNFNPIPADADDLDIDAVPTSGDLNSQWGPALSQIIYPRRRTSSSSRWDVFDDWDRAPWTPTTQEVSNNTSYACPTEARVLQEWPDAGDFQDYVDGLRVTGTTYHDIGLLWGARFASPDGMFSATNRLTPEGGEIEHHIIFMTDGVTNANANDYNAYGVPWFDRRQTSDNAVPTKAQLDQQVNLRFSALCTEIKNRNITLWIIGFGDEIASDSATQTRLQTCATSGRYFLATDAAALQTTFRNIADQISQLRLTR